MEKQIRRFEHTDKKIDVRIKDRGDLKTFVPKLNSINNTRLKKYENKPKNAFPDGDSNKPKIVYPDGDSKKVSTNQRQEKTKVNIIMKLPTREDTRPNTEAEDSRQHTDRKQIAKEAEKKAVMELKRIREKYAVKLKTSSLPTSQVKKEDAEKLKSVKSDVKNVSIEPINRPQNIPHTKENNTISLEDRDDKECSNTRRKPLIKTVVGKNGSLPIYKAVTFVEQKRRRTKLDISIPNPAASNSNNKQNPSKCTDTSSLGPASVAVSVRDKPPARRKSPRKRDLKRNRRNVSPAAICDFRDNRSPSTEVAKWAPSSVNQETKPYYEAWVNTRLAAISKSRETDKSYLNDREFLKSFKKALDRPTTPDLFYLNFADEKYTGRIKIKQKK